MRLSSSAILDAADQHEQQDQVDEALSYAPKHPMLQCLDAIRGEHYAKPDHLDKYVEVDPFAKKTAVVEETVVAEETAAEEKE